MAKQNKEPKEPRMPVWRRGRGSAETRGAVDQPIIMRSSAVSDVGYVRSNNQDSAFAGTHIIIIADGMGGHAGGDTASTIAVRSLAHIEHLRPQSSIQDIAVALMKSVLAAHDAIVGKAKKEPELSGMGTTIDAVTLVQGYWVLAHIGDSRSYLLHEGQLIQMTKDHSYVQHLVDTGRITKEEAKTHPQRNVVMRVLGDFDIDPHPDIAVRRAAAGDRWLLCSDGLCGSLEQDTIEEVLQSTQDREQCAQKLVNMALKAGSTDNVSAVIADTLDPKADQNPIPQIPLVGGAASANIETIADIVHKPVATAPILRPESTPALKAAELLGGSRDEIPSVTDGDSEHNDAEHPPKPPEIPSQVTQSQIENFEQVNISSSDLRENLGLHDDQQLARPSGIPDAQEVLEESVPPTGEIPVVIKENGAQTSDPSDPEVAQILKNAQSHEAQRIHQKKIRHRIVSLGILAIILVLAAIGGLLGWNWSQSQYYVGESKGVIAIYQGVPAQIFNWQLSHPVKLTTTEISSLPPSWQETLAKGITKDINNYDDALERAQSITQQAVKNNQSDQDGTGTQ